MFDLCVTNVLCVNKCVTRVLCFNMCAQMC